MIATTKQQTLMVTHRLNQHMVQSTDNFTIVLLREKKIVTTATNIKLRKQLAKQFVIFLGFLLLFISALHINTKVD